MKIGIISDIHGNVKALNAVLKKLENHNIEKIICLGDLIGGAPMSEEVVQKIIEIKDNLIIVRGNRERYIIEGMPKVVHDEKIEVSKEQHERFIWLKNSLSDSAKEYIHTLPKELTYEVDGKKIYICHYPMRKDGNFRHHVKNATPKENEVMFEGIDADMYLYGHTHEEIYNNINNKMYINPGALGCPCKTNYAPYGILTVNNGKQEYEQKYAEYNVQEVIDDIKQIKFPGYEGVLRLFYGGRN